MSGGEGVSCLPFDPGHQEVEVALDLGAVPEAVDVQGVHSLPVGQAGPDAH